MTQHTHENHRNPDEIESDIEQTRSRLDDTLNQLETKFSPQQLMNDTYDYVRHGGANDFVSNLGTTIKQNPMPVMIAGIGLGWLMLSSSQRNRHDSDYYDDDYDHLDYGSSDLNDAAMHSSTLPPTTAASPNRPVTPRATGTPAVGVAGETTTAGTSGTIGAGTTSSGTDPTLVGTPTDHTRRHGRGQGKMRATKDKARHMMSGARDRTAHAKDSSRAAMGSLSHRAQGAGTEASHFIQEHPLVAGALGIALGAALGGLLPSTRTEDEYLGETRDKALDKAATMGEQQAEKAQASMREKGEHARANTGNASTEQTSSPGTATPPPMAKAGSPSQATPSPAGQTAPPDRPASDKPLSSGAPGDEPPPHPRSDNPPTRGN